MLMSELDYHLPPERIATRPAEPRDASRLMVVSETVEHRIFAQVTDYLRAGDLLVVNETRVLPAKLALRRRTGAAIPGLSGRAVTTPASCPLQRLQAPPLRRYAPADAHPTAISPRPTPAAAANT